jgi:hypothetical protein
MLDKAKQAHLRHGSIHPAEVIPVEFRPLQTPHDDYPSNAFFRVKIERGFLGYAALDEEEAVSEGAVVGDEPDCAKGSGFSPGVAEAAAASASSITRLISAERCT